ncbi:hypothetical protein VNO77_43198 [Canavalia gladiata]|uniref:Uncharacterized protein n=1 Tax=Canavalia gladiata TaxID=3824 RepID=A0AAN9JTM1_CANGL
MYALFLSRSVSLTLFLTTTTTTTYQCPFSLFPLFISKYPRNSQNVQQHLLLRSNIILLISLGIQEVYVLGFVLIQDDLMVGSFELQSVNCLLKWVMLYCSESMEKSISYCIYPFPFPCHYKWISDSFAS